MEENTNNLTVSHAEWYKTLLAWGCELQIGEAVPYGHRYTIIPPAGKEVVIEKADHGRVNFVIRDKVQKGSPE